MIRGKDYSLIKKALHNKLVYVCLYLYEVIMKKIYLLLISFAVTLHASERASLVGGFGGGNRDREHYLGTMPSVQVQGIYHKRSWVDIAGTFACVGATAVIAAGHASGSYPDPNDQVARSQAAGAIIGGMCSSAFSAACSVSSMSNIDSNANVRRVDHAVEHRRYHRKVTLCRFASKLLPAVAATAALITAPYSSMPDETYGAGVFLAGYTAASITKDVIVGLITEAKLRSLGL